MIKFISIRFLSALLVILWGMNACKQDGNSSGKLVEEIQTQGKISSIIRSPINADGTVDTVNVAKMTFEQSTYDFGEVKEGEVVRYVFKFKNDGKVPLVINNAHSTCGCTVPQWPKSPVNPGETGEIKVEFNTRSKLDYQEKPVIISANTYPSSNRVFLKGYVVK